MPLAALGLLALSASLHTLWNLLLKQSPDKMAVSWWTTVIGSALALPILLVIGLPPRPMWPFLAVSVAAEAFYYILLAKAYQRSDFSQAYPIARGAAPAFLTLWSILFLREYPSPGGYLGLLMIMAGLMLVGSGNFDVRNNLAQTLRSIGPALGTAVMISTYTVIDGTAVRLGPSLPYALSIFLLVPLALTPFILLRYPWAQLAACWHEQAWRLPIISVLGMIAYALALGAYQLAPVGYAGAIREMSVVFGALAGWLFLKEGFGRARVTGAIIVFAGILIISIYG